MTTPPALACLLLLTAGCSWHTTATRWNGRVGENGKPVFVKVTTNVGFNLAIVVPALGNITIAEMVDANTKAIAETGGDRVRVVETAVENYWYGIPPVSWIFTPVITEVVIEYEPTEEEMRKAKEAFDAQDPGDRRPYGLIESERKPK